MKAERHLLDDTLVVTLTVSQYIVRGTLLLRDSTDDSGATGGFPAGTGDEQRGLITVALEDFNTISPKADSYHVRCGEFGVVPVFNDGSGAISTGDELVSGESFTGTVGPYTTTIYGVKTKGGADDQVIGVAMSGCSNQGELLYMRRPY